MRFSRREYWSGLLFLSPGDLFDPGIKPTSLVSPALAGRFFTTAPPGKSITIGNSVLTTEPSGKSQIWAFLHLTEKRRHFHRCSKARLQKAFLTKIMEKNLNTWNKSADKLPCNLKNSDVLVLGNVDNLLDNTVLKQNPETCECVWGERDRENRREITVETWPPH